MNKHFIYHRVVVLVTGIVFGVILYYLLCYGWVFYSNWNPYQKAQEKLADKLGVEINDYSYPVSFPSGYYYDTLKPGMSRKQVHTLIQGYEVVYHCKKYSEVYYYFSVKDEKALRFKIRYDSMGNYQELVGEESDSRTIQLFGCEKGQILDTP